MKVIKVLFLFVLLIYSKSVLADQQKEYAPYPIIFVHGYNAEELPTWNKPSCWRDAKTNLEKFFYERGNYKYPSLDTKEKYFPTVNYGYQKTGLISKNGDIPAIASQVLLPKVKWALDNCFPPHYSESERKVIIVAHSMGGLVARSFLTQFSEYQNKIDKVVFIDVPHLGSPYASAVWMIDKEAKEKLPSLIREYSTSFSKSVGNLRFLSPGTRTIVETIFNHISWNLQKRLNRDIFFLEAIEFRGTDPDGYAVDKMRLPFQSEYHDKIFGWHSWQYKSVPIDIVYGPSETFLGSTNLAIPSNFKIISGKVPSNFGEEGYLGYKAFEYVTGILFSYREGSPLGFSFEPGYTLEDTKTTGDGVVPKLSQEKLSKGTEAKSDYPIIAAHGSAPDNWETILQAIDDKPVIESVRAVPVDWNKPNMEFYGTWSHLISQEYYLIFKVKDYLLADIEIESLTIDGSNPSVDLSMFEADGKYKPYNYKRDEKAFLKERDDTSATFKNIYGDEEYLKDLKPGEFWVKATIPANATQVKFRIKNPAAEYDAESFTAERTFYIKRPGIANIDWGPYWSIAPGFLAFIDVPPYDYSPLYDEKGKIIVLHYYPSSASRYLDLSFSIVNSPYSEVKCNAWLYDLNFTSIWKKFCTNKVVPPLSGSPYSGVVNDIPRWHGDKEGGGYIEGYDVFNTDYEHQPNYHNIYRLVVTVETTNDDPKDDILPLLGSSLHGGDGGTILCADPTFIQASRREGVSW